MVVHSRRFVVLGRVQGVGYRWFARDSARALGVSGWVRNRADGSVELEASGPPEALAALAARLRQGPPAARVTELIEQPLPGAPAGAAPSDFELRPTA